MNTWLIFDCPHTTFTRPCVESHLIKTKVAELRREERREKREERREKREERREKREERREKREERRDLDLVS
jgi:hypothetical protein